MLGKFRNINTAFAASNRTIKASVVIMGDDNRFWVVTMKVGFRLLAAGFELAPIQ